jgi:hypothetical protein
MNDINRACEERLKALFDQTREAAASKRSLQNAAVWKGVPSASEKRPNGAFRVFLGASYMNRALNVDIRRYYTEPALYLESSLRLNLLAFEAFQDDVPVTLSIPWHPGVIMESSLFGVEAIYFANKEPWESHDYPLRRCADLASLQAPDFYSSKAMRYIHRMYDGIRELILRLAPDFTVTFPGWRRSPFAVACSLRGMERLAMDFYDNEGFVHALLQFLTDARIRWDTERTKYIGTQDPYTLGNDEVNVPVLSPAQYETFVLPYERRLLDHYGRLSYFHSCGCLTPLIPFIRTLNPSLFHVSPWTDLSAACDAFAGTGALLDVWAHVSDDVMNASARQAQAAMARRVRICRESRIAGFQLNSGNIQTVKPSLAEDNAQINQWVAACRHALSGCSADIRR